MPARSISSCPKSKESAIPIQPDLLIRDLLFNSSNMGSIAMFVGGDISGIVRVEGTLRFENAFSRERSEHSCG